MIIYNLGKYKLEIEQHGLRTPNHPKYNSYFLVVTKKGDKRNEFVKGYELPSFTLDFTIR